MASEGSGPACTCSHIQVGNRPTGESRNWRDDCPTHGIGSAWYEEHGRAQWRAAVEAQMEAARRRKEVGRDGE